MEEHLGLETWSLINNQIIKDIEKIKKKALLMQQFQLTITPFQPVGDCLTFAFYGDKQMGFALNYWDKLFESFPGGREVKQKNNYLDYNFTVKVSVKTTSEPLTHQCLYLKQNGLLLPRFQTITAVRQKHP